MFETKSSKDILSRLTRVIGHIKGKKKGPTLIFFGGIHGNEPAGVYALNKVLDRLENYSSDCFGELYALAGNLNALKKNMRYEDEDLNRIWFADRLASKVNSHSSSKESIEMLELYELIVQIMEVSRPPYYFIDIHTTSGASEPFLVVNDSLLNRKFTKKYPLPVILGIEEYLNGALLSYMNDWGYVAFGFESGQHETPSAVTNAINFIWYTMALTGFYQLERDKVLRLHKALHGAGTSPKSFYEIYYQHLLTENDKFLMMPGFVNFEMVDRATAIAYDKNGPIVAKRKRRLFMPLYQKKGTEGFYYIRKIPLIFLALSKHLRWIGADSILTLLPGIDWASPKKDSLMVDKRVARFYAKAIFHLLGYRARALDKEHLVLKNRERNSRNLHYKNAPWY